MARRTADWVLIVVLMASWGVLFVRALDDGLRTQRGALPIAVSAASANERYPIVKSGRQQPPGLLPGDELTAVDGESLRGVSALGFYDLATRAARQRGFAEVTAMRAGDSFSVRLSLAPLPEWWLGLLVYSLNLLSGLTLLAHSPGWHLARRYFVAAWLFAVARAVYEPSQGPSATFFQASLNYLGWGLGAVLTVWNAQEFTVSARPVPKLHRCLALAVGILFAATFVARYYLPLHTVAVSDLLLFGSASSLAAGTIAGGIRAYKRSAPLERRQIRWMVLGFLIALAGVALGSVMPLLTTATGRLGDPEVQLLGRLLTTLPVLALPIGITISVVGYRWLDIDRLISATAAYAIAAVAILGAALAATPRLAAGAAPALGVETGAAQWLLDMAFVSAAGFAAHRWLRPPLDRRMFAERHRRMSGLELLRDQLGSCSGAEELWALASERIDALLEPESLVVYARDGKQFVPRFARGAASAPSYDADSLLVRALERRSRPLAADAAELDPFDRAALETLGVALVVPIRAQDGVIAFACLGPKRSGDIYTSEERAHLAALGARCGQLVRPAAVPEARPAQVFRREGDVWTLASNGKEVRVRDVRGLHYLAMLLREPGREFAPIDMVRAADGLAPARVESHGAELRLVRGLGDAGSVLDAQARAEYRARIAELEAELTDAERCADLGRLERASAEREALLAELDASARGRRAAPAGSDTERARVAVTKAIKTALDRIGEAHPELGAHLSAAVRRGYMCAYQPDARDAADWEV